MARLLSAEDVLGALFTQTQFRDGYDEREVDVLLDEVVAVLRQHAAGAPPGLTAEQVEAKRFTATRFRRGYDQGDVDAFLADVVHTLRHLESGGRPVAPASPAGAARGVGWSSQAAAEPTLGAKVLRALRGDRG